MPLIRYWTNDITNLYYDSNGKRTHIKMGPIRGRADDMLVIRGVNLFHTQVEAILNELPEFSPHYHLIVTKEGAMDAVEVQVELNENIYSQREIQDIYEHLSSDYVQNLHHLLAQKIKDNIGLTMKVSIQNYGAVPRSEGGKLSRIKDLRNKS